MATITGAAIGLDQRVVLHGVSWQTYQDLLRTEESRRGSVRMMYDRGRLVLMSPSMRHEKAGELLGLIVRLTALELDLNCMGIGRTTLTKEEALRGKEPDTAFYLANEPRVREKGEEELDLNVDPPPDLAIEVEIMHRDKGMLDVYASLGVPEVWHYNGQSLRVLQRQDDGKYAEVPASPALPFLPLNELAQWLARADSEGESAMLKAFVRWVRDELAPRFRPGGVP